MTNRWRRRARRVMRRVLPPRTGAVILGYHRIADPEMAAGGDPYRMCVSPRAFREQMQTLRAIGRPVSLPHLLRALQAGVSVRGMIAVTFDDAYEEVLSVALPELERQEVPATVYFVAGNGGRPFWWDRLTAILADADPQMPFRVKVGASRFVWQGLGEFDRLRVGLHRALRILPADEREDTLDRLATVWQIEQPAKLPRALTLDEARQLVGSMWIDPGAHSITHPPLAEIPPRRAEAEIAGSRRRLTADLGLPIEAFSYPHGSASSTTDRLVRQAGYTFACASRQDSVRRDVDLFRLPRVWVTDRSDGAFRRRVARYVGSGAGHPAER